MKVFEVVTQYCKDDKIIDEHQFVSGITLKGVADYFTKRCEEIGHDLKSVREVLTIVEHVSE